jgi:hypothetical protein
VSLRRRSTDRGHALRRQALKTGLAIGSCLARPCALSRGNVTAVSHTLRVALTRERVVGWLGHRRAGRGRRILLLRLLLLRVLLLLLRVLTLRILLLRVLTLRILLLVAALGRRLRFGFTSATTCRQRRAERREYRGSPDCASRCLGTPK